MPIYEYYCRDNHRIYQFYAKTLAQGRAIPPCPDGPNLRMEKIVSAFAVVGGGKKEEGGPAAAADAGAEEGPDDARLAALEGEMAGMDENDPRAMGRMMRRMAEASGERIQGPMEEMVRKLEEGADPESLEDALADEGGDADEGEPAVESAAEAKETRAARRNRRGAPCRDPVLYDYPQS